MAISETFQAFALDQLARIAPLVRGKRMIGGLGVYSGETFFALADADRLYLKADDVTCGRFVEQGWAPFRPFGDNRLTMQYYEVPPELIENVERLRPWVELALEAAARGAKNKRKPAKRTETKARVSAKASTPRQSAEKKRGNRGLRGKRG